MNDTLNQLFLDEDQLDNVTTISSILNQYSFCIDTSKAGAGKTRMCCYVCKEKNIKNIIVVCNNNLQTELWKDNLSKFNLDVNSILTYDNLRGSKSIKHSLLYKVDDKYYPTDYFKDLVAEGLALIADECHSIKNNSNKRLAFKELSSYITNYNNSINQIKSFTYFISMTPFDKEEHCINIISTCGIINNKLYDENKKEPLGLYELYNFCKKIDLENTKKLWGVCDITEKNCQDMAYSLIVNIVLRKITSFTKNSSKGYLSKQSIYYSYFTITEQGNSLMKRAINMISKNLNKKITVDELIDETANLDLSDKPNNLDLTDIDSLNFNYITSGEGKNLNERNGIIPGIITIHTIKTYFILISFIKIIYEQINNSKVVVFLNYKESINVIMNFLSEFNPVKITGDFGCTQEERVKIIKKFNEPNLDCRLLVIISQIGSDSIELDDKDGNFPRVGLAFPDFYYSKYFQCPGRIFRFNTKSNSLFFFCLVNSEENREESIENSIIEKSKVMEETLQNNQIIPPSNYKQIVNPHEYGLSNLLINAGKEIITSNVKKIKPIEENKIILPNISVSF